MRKIGSLTSKADAQRFQRYLTHQGIQNRLDETGGQQELWVYEESQVAGAKDLLAEFVKSPVSTKFDAPVVTPPTKVETAPPPRPVRPVRTDGGAQAVPVTILITFLCFWLTMSTNFGKKPELMSELLIAPPGSQTLEKVREGQIWRLVTPIFLHGNFLHLGFNVYIFWILGGVIERLKGSGHLLVLCLIIAILSNLAQFQTSGPNFLGLSGVVYGLFGFIWMRSMLLPEEGFFMPQGMVVQMILWAVICVLARDNFPVANAAHFGGLFVGMVAGALPRLWRRA